MRTICLRYSKAQLIMKDADKAPRNSHSAGRSQAQGFSSMIKRNIALVRSQPDTYKSVSQGRQIQSKFKQSFGNYKGRKAYLLF